MKKLSVAIVILVIWQIIIAAFAPITDVERISSVTGLQEEFRDFVPLYNYLGLFPVRSDKHTPTDQKEAQNIIDNHADTLVMEKACAIRSGDYNKLFLFLPNIYLTGSAENPSVLLATSVVFISTLVLLLISFYSINQFRLGCWVTFSLGVTPFLLHEAYRHDNIFTLTTSSALLLLAGFLPFLYGKQMRYGRFLILVLLSGLMFGFLKGVRAENLMMLAALIPLILFLTHYPWYKKVFGIFVLVISLFLTSSYFKTYFQEEFSDTKEFVAKVGGHPFAGPRHTAHNFWHSIFIGLGDFDNKYGYEWSDYKSAETIMPLMQEKYGIPVMDLNEDVESEVLFFDEAKKYPLRPFEYEEFGILMREKVLGDILGDPLWFAGIILKRVARLLYRSTSIAPFFGVGPLIPIPLILILGFCIYWWRQGFYFYVYLVAFTMPLAILAIALHSKAGITFFPMGNIIGFAILGHLYIGPFIRKRVTKIWT